VELVFGIGLGKTAYNVGGDLNDLTNEDLPYEVRARSGSRAGGASCNSSWQDFHSFQSGGPICQFPELGKVSRVRECSTPEGTKWRIPFRKNRPDFDSFVEQGHSFRKVEGLTGDAAMDRVTMLKRVQGEFGLPSLDATKEWLRSYKTPYGTGLRLHHSGPQGFQLVPRKVHAIAHGGFSGSAAALRGR
jgi:hypothetical protein